MSYYGDLFLVTGNPASGEAVSRQKALTKAGYDVEIVSPSELEVICADHDQTNWLLPRDALAVMGDAEYALLSSTNSMIQIWPSYYYKSGDEIKLERYAEENRNDHLQMLVDLSQKLNENWDLLSQKAQHDHETENLHSSLDLQTMPDHQEPRILWGMSSASLLGELEIGALKKNGIFITQFDCKKPDDLRYLIDRNQIDAVIIDSVNSCEIDFIRKTVKTNPNKNLRAIPVACICDAKTSTVSAHLLKQNIQPLPITDACDAERLSASIHSMTMKIRLHNAIHQKMSGLKQAAYMDFLTGVHSRPAFKVFIDVLLQQSPVGTDEGCSVIMLDLNRLKQLNDNYGHAVGDKAIAALGQALTRIFRSESHIEERKKHTSYKSDQNASLFIEDFILRYGGDEFLVILPGCSRQNIRHVIQRINEELPHIFAEIIEDDDKLTNEERTRLNAVGFGAGTDFITYDDLQKLAKCYPESAKLIGAIANNADAALYDAKKQKDNGRFQYVAAREKQNAAANSNVSDNSIILVSDLEKMHGNWPTLGVTKDALRP